VAGDDRELWECISRGDIRAFDGFYRECAPSLLSFVRQMTGSKQAAEDITQDTFLQLWRRPNGFQPEKGPLRAYLFGIGRKRAAEWRRHNTPVGDTGPDEGATASGEASSVMADALSRLDPEQHALLWLREVEGQSYAELAEILGIPVGTVKSRLFTAREELRGIWTCGRVRKQEGENV
jgi:RNA polymerase sigma-70 factor, ECF subfamily